MPEAYGIQSFRRESLPIIPDSFQLTPRQVKTAKGYKADPGALKQLKVIKAVFDQSDKIIVDTDAGREGAVSYTHLDVYKRQPYTSPEPYKANVPIQLKEKFMWWATSDVNN